MSENFRIYQNVRLGKKVAIGDYVIIGVPSRGENRNESDTIIGDHGIIRSHTVIYEGNVIGDYFQTGHGVLIREGNRIGRNVSIGSGSVVEHHIHMGDNVRLHSNVFVPEYTVLEEGCWLGPNVVLTNAKYPISPNVKKELKGVVIKRKAKVGANATVLPGIIVGENALIGAGSVVTDNVPPNTVVAGNPATVMKNISDLPYPESEE